MKARHKRLALIAGGLVTLAVASVFIFNALGNNLSYFFSPTEIAEGKAPADHLFRLGGLVEKGSLKRSDKDLGVSFMVTDGRQTMEVRYVGILPDLFQEGQGMIAQGRLSADGKYFAADEVLAKHDEKYMPPEVADALEKGHMEGVKTMVLQGAKQ